MRSFILIILLSPIGLLAQDFAINKMHVEVSIDREGVAVVDEYINVTFREPLRGIFREIPYKYKFKGVDYILPMNDFDTGIDPLKLTKKREMYHLRIGDPDQRLTGSKDYHIKYKVIGPFIQSDEYEEFYWNLSGKWEKQIEQFSYHVSLSTADVITPENVLVYAGPTKSSTQVTGFSIDQNRVFDTLSQAINPGEEVTVALKLPRGYIESDAIAKIASDRAISLREAIGPSKWWLMLPLGLFASILGWWRGIRGARKEYDIVPISVPPAGMSPAEVGVFIDDKAHDRDIISLLPYWANLGFITIEDKYKILYFTKVKEISKDRPDYEKLFFNKIFASSTVVSIDDIKTKMYSTVNTVKSDIVKTMYREKLYDDTYVKWFKSTRIVFPILAMMCVGLTALILNAILVAIASFVCAVLILIIPILPPPTSETGLALKAKLKGLEKHLRSSDPEEIAEIMKRDPSYFERIFPYAVALGLDKSFISKVNTQQADFSSPIWFMIDGSRSDMNSFADSFDTKTISSAFASYPQSSNSGGIGSGGGGSSGGGFGGGGGGAW